MNIGQDDKNKLYKEKQMLNFKGSNTGKKTCKINVEEKDKM